MASKKTPVRLDKEAVVILNTIQKMISVPVSLTYLANQIIKTHGPKFNVNSIKK